MHQYNKSMYLFNFCFKNKIVKATGLDKFVHCSCSLIVLNNYELQT